MLFIFPIVHFPIRESGRKYGRGTGEILLDNLICIGSEASLLDCSHNPLKMTNCASDHSEDAGVICGGILFFTKVLLSCLNLFQLLVKMVM